MSIKRTMGDRLMAVPGFANGVALTRVLSRLALVATISELLKPNPFGSRMLGRLLDSSVWELLSFRKRQQKSDTASGRHESEKSDQG